MFTQFKNIDTAFSHIKRFSFFLILACVLISCFTIWKSFDLVARAQDRVQILYNGQLLGTVASSRKANIPVMLRSHIKTFHEHFFNLDPDDKGIQTGITKALYLADESAKKAYDNLREKGFYNNMVAANISQEIEIDSITLDLNPYPYRFVCYAKQKLIRSSSKELRRLITTGEVRELRNQTDNNPNGFLIQRWETLENREEKP